MCKGKRIAFGLLVALLVLPACSRKVVEPTIVERERIITNTRTEYITDTVFADIPAQTAEAVVLDSISVLENEYAITTARIQSNGTLYHTLATKPQRVPVQHQTPVVYKDSIVYKDKQVQVPYPVEKKLTKWQQAKVDYFGWLAAVLVLVLGYAFRKPLLTLARRLI